VLICTSASTTAELEGHPLSVSSPDVRVFPATPSFKWGVSNAGDLRSPSARPSPVGASVTHRHFLGFCFLLEMGSLCVAQAGFKLTILLPQPPEGCDYRCVPPHSAQSVIVRCHQPPLTFGSLILAFFLK
jgi:hypothetical protein